MTALRTPGIRRPFGFRYANHPPPRTVKSMDKNKSTNQATYKTSEAACQLGVSAEWLRKGEERGFFSPARRDWPAARSAAEERAALREHK